MNNELNNPIAEQQPHITVVGGGMLGLTLAYQLSKQNVKVSILEGAANLGGLTESIKIGDLHWDKYYHVTMLSDADLRALLAELDLEHEINWKVTKTHFYTGKGMYPLNNAFDYLKLPVLGLIDKVRLGLTIIYASRLEQGSELEKLTAKQWLTKLSGSKAYQNVWRPLLRAKLGNNYKKVSAAFIWAVIRRFYAARRGGLKTEMFGYVPGGYERIINKLVEKLSANGAQIITSAAVLSVTQNQTNGLKVKTHSHEYDFDQVIMTCPSQHVATICPQLTEAEKAQHNSLVYQGIICPSIMLKKSVGGAYLTYITDDKVPFTAVIEMSSLVEFADAEHPHLVYLPKYVPADDPLFDMTDKQIEEQFVSAFLSMYPFLTRDDVLAVKVSRSRQVVALSTLHYSQNLPAIHTSINGLHILNSAQIKNASLSVQETVKLANEGAQTFLQSINESGPA
ncbi:NAD(P)/FAD-dependent oxidoreductase [Aliiglaciecola litoralis]